MNKEISKHFPLSKLPVGVDACVYSLIGGRCHRSKVVGLGLNIGAELRVERTTSSTNGSIIISIGNSRLVIGYGIAKKIIVLVI